MVETGFKNPSAMMSYCYGCLQSAAKLYVGLLAKPTDQGTVPRQSAGNSWDELSAGTGKGAVLVVPGC